QSVASCPVMPPGPFASQYFRRWAKMTVLEVPSGIAVSKLLFFPGALADVLLGEAGFGSEAITLAPALPGAQVPGVPFIVSMLVGSVRSLGQTYVGIMLLREKNPHRFPFACSPWS